jgi:signal transduction histidine kinase
LLFELRPSTLAEAELGPLLHQLGESVTGRARLPVTVTIEGHCELPNEVKIAVYRIAQETLNNIIKHSGASSAEIGLGCAKNGITLRISDNGRGFNPDGVSVSSLGLGIMQDRAREIGAELTVESQIGQGTRVTVKWHMPGKEAQCNGN